MDVQVHAVDFDADRKLIDFLNLKLQKLVTYSDKLVKSEVFLKLGNPSEPENKIVEIKMHLKGKELFVKKQCKTFEEAIDQNCQALRRQVQKHKEKLSA